MLAEWLERQEKLDQKMDLKEERLGGLSHLQIMPWNRSREDIANANTHHCMPQLDTPCHQYFLVSTVGTPPLLPQQMDVATSTARMDASLVVPDS